MIILTVTSQLPASDTTQSSRPGGGAHEEMGDHCFFAGFKAVIKLIVPYTILKSALLCEVECVCDERGREITEVGEEQLCNGWVEVGGRVPCVEHLPQSLIKSQVVGLCILTLKSASHSHPTRCRGHDCTTGKYGQRLSIPMSFFDEKGTCFLLFR